MPGQKIHASVSFIRHYTPRATFSSGMSEEGWNRILGKGERHGTDWAKGIEDLLEMDLFDYSAVKVLIDKVNQDPRNTSFFARLEFIALTRMFMDFRYDCLPFLILSIL